MLASCYKLTAPIYIITRVTDPLQALCEPRGARCVVQAAATKFIKPSREGGQQQLHWQRLLAVCQALWAGGGVQPLLRAAGAAWGARAPAVSLIAKVVPFIFIFDFRTIHNAGTRSARLEHPTTARPAAGLHQVHSSRRLPACWAAQWVVLAPDQRPVGCRTPARACLRPSRPWAATAAPTAAASGWARQRQQQRQQRLSTVWCNAASGQPVDPEASAYLTRALPQLGTSLEALQREAPEVSAALDLPLAQALVAALERRQALRDRSSKLSPAQLAERLVFLACEAGLSAKEVRRVFGGRPESLYFGLVSGRTALGWLRQQGLTPEQLQQALLWQPQLLHTSLDALEAGKAGLQRLFGLSDAEWAAKAYADPLILGLAPASAQAVVDWLRSPAVGMDAAGVRRLFQRNALLFASSPASLSATLGYLLARLEIPQSKAAALVAQGTAILLSKGLLTDKIRAYEAYGEPASG